MPLSEHGTTSFVDGSTGPGHAGRPEYARGADGVGASASSADSTLDPEPEPEAAAGARGRLLSRGRLLPAREVGGGWSCFEVLAHGPDLGPRVFNRFLRGDKGELVCGACAAAPPCSDAKGCSCVAGFRGASQRRGECLGFSPRR